VRVCWKSFHQVCSGVCGGDGRDEGGGAGVVRCSVIKVVDGGGVRIEDTETCSEGGVGVAVAFNSCFRGLWVENARMVIGRWCRWHVCVADFELDSDRGMRTVRLQRACCERSCAIAASAVLGRHARIRVDAEEVAISRICPLGLASGEAGSFCKLR
jgi:hypothetical protein